MPKSTNVFAQRLNSCMDELGAPSHVRERAQALSKLTDIPKQKAWSLLEGHMNPDEEVLAALAQEFEVDPEWLVGSK